MTPIERGYHIRGDRRELEGHIKDLERKLQDQQQTGLSDWLYTNRQLRKLRRMRY